MVQREDVIELVLALIPFEDGLVVDDVIKVDYVGLDGSRPVLQQLDLHALAKQ